MPKNLCCICNFQRLSTKPETIQKFLLLVVLSQRTRKHHLIYYSKCKCSILSIETWLRFVFFIPHLFFFICNLILSNFIRRVTHLAKNSCIKMGSFSWIHVEIRFEVWFLASPNIYNIFFSEIIVGPISPQHETRHTCFFKYLFCFFS